MNNEMLRLNINLEKLEKEHFFKGAKGTYVDLTLIPSRDSQYGDSHFIVQDVGKEKRLAGIKGPIVGNAKPVGGPQQPAGQTTPPASKIAPEDVPGALPADDDVPF